MHTFPPKRSSAPTARSNQNNCKIIFYKKRRIAADGCRRIAVCSDFVPCSTAEPFYAISYSVKKRATPAGKLLALQAVCSPIAVKTVSKRYKRRGSICAISYAIKINAVALHFHRAAAFIFTVLTQKSKYRTTGCRKAVFLPESDEKEKALRFRSKILIPFFTFFS